MKAENEYRPSEIVKMIEDGFKLVHKPFAKYQHEQTELWQKCISTISDYNILEKMIFCNDILKIPPSKVFLCVALSDNEANKLTACDKKFIGSFFAYMFGTIFFYQSKKRISLNNPNFKSAMYFYERSEMINILPDILKKEPSKVINIDNEIVSVTVKNEKKPNKGTKKD